MRHGETLYLGRGSPGGIDLTPEGRRQIAVAAELFDAVRLDLVVASPMRRAMDTAGMIASRQHLAVEPVADLREISPAGLDGMEVAEIFSQVLRFFSSPEVTWDTPFVGGETFRELIARVQRFLAMMLGRIGWTTALAVAHGGANMALIASVLGLAEGEIPKLEQDLGCINAIDFDDGGRALLRLLNLSAHDLLKATMREPSSARLRNLLEGRGRELAGVRWRTGPGDPELY